MKSLLLKIAFVLVLLTPVALAQQVAFAADCSTATTAQGAIQQGADGASGDTTCPTVQASSKKAASDLQTTIGNILNVLSLIIGALAVIMVIVGGARYVTSGGKQESVSAAKNTIVYAAIGLAVASVSQILIHFVLKITST